MKITDFKYLFALTLPISTYISLENQGIMSWTSLIYAFIFIPIIENVLSTDDNNDHIEDQNRATHFFFDALLYLNLPFVVYMVYLGMINIPMSLNAWDYAGKTISLGIFLGACGINVAHELGHKQNLFSQIAAKLLLAPCYYVHFTLQHNRGHHLNVGTSNDPATAKYNEALPLFWLRSITGTYFQAWQLENQRLNRLNLSRFNKIVKNEMVWNSIIVKLYSTFILAFYGFEGLMIALVIGAISILLLETINYIEHYGLERKLLPNGKYERVEIFHSWNSNHPIGRILLYELTRHADHHYKANKKYQSLLHYDDSPQLPLGYPASMLLSLIPHLWFKKMNPLVDAIRNNQ
ncbi:MAG: hypothetical protein RLZZ546_2590 [Bacteroidota bacterium]